MHGLMTLIVMGVNFGISWWNAKQAGQSWLEAKALGGFVWVVTLCAAIQSALGFTTVICYVLASIAKGAGLLSDSAYQAVAALDYLMVVIPLIGTGLIITLASWRIAFREKSLASMGTAAYNTLAMAYDIASAAKNTPSLIDSLKFLGSSGDGEKDEEDSGIGLKVVMIVLAALVLGILLTVWIVRTNIRKASLARIVQAAPPQAPSAVMQANPAPNPPVTNRPPVLQSQVSQGYASAVERSVTPPAAAPQAPPLPAGKGSMSKGAWVLLTVIMVCATAAFLGCLYTRSHPLDNYVGSAPNNSPASSDTTSTLSGVLGDSDGDTHASGATTTGEPAPQAAQTQQPVPPPSQQATQQDAQQGGNAQPATHGRVVAQVTQTNVPAQASTANPLPVGAEDWPTLTPCIKKLEDAYRKDRQAQGLDDTISMDQANDFASTCKTIGQ